MSNKVNALIGLGIICCAAGLLATAAPGCGGSSSNAQAICVQTCNKFTTCGLGTSTPTECSQQCSSPDSGVGSEVCTNESALEAAANKCLAMTDCAAFISCGQSIPDCQMPGGTGGTSGSGGASGTGGSTGSGGASGTGGSTGTGGAAGNTCAVCTKAGTCCAAIPGEDAATCAMINAATCNSVPAASQAGLIMDCQLIISDGALLNVAACK
jgi:hypothetical protein